MSLSGVMHTLEITPCASATTQLSQPSGVLEAMTGTITSGGDSRHLVCAASGHERLGVLRFVFSFANKRNNE